MANKRRCTCGKNVEEIKYCRYPHNGVQTKSTKKRPQ